MTPRLEVLTGTLALPVHHGAGVADECSFPPAHQPKTLPAIPFGGHPASRTIEHDLLTGAITLVVGDGGEGLIHAHGLWASSVMWERWTIQRDDPLSAVVEIGWWQQLFRKDPRWSIQTKADVRMTATADALHMTATLVAREGDEVVFRRDWDESVPRLWL